MKKVYAVGEMLIDFTAGQIDKPENVNVFYKNAGLLLFRDLRKPVFCGKKRKIDRTVLFRRA